MGLPFISKQAKKRDHIVAIDLGSRTSKAVHLQRRGDRFSLLSYAILDAPAQEKSFSSDVLGNHLRALNDELKNTRSKKITLTVGVTDSLLRQVEVPMMPAADIRQMLKFNSKTYLQQDLPDHVFDCFILPQQAPPPKSADGKSGEASRPSGPPKMRVVVGGAKRKMMDDLANAAKIAGLAAEQIVPSLLGPTNAFEMAEPAAFAKEIIAIVDIGFKNTTISILQSGEVILNRVLAIGGDRITAALAESMNISYAEAEGIKVGMPTEVQQAMEGILNPLGRELRASIDFFEHQQDKTVSQVFLSGGSARSEFIVQSLQNELMVPCKSWNPAQFLDLALPPEKMGEFEQVAPQLVVAIGAAAAGF
ncbi:MAG TPA: pilus assembly protein PilM [Verrucomicrobiae bacterium]|jgi:type IV pilus assembly protein PilM